MLIIDAKKNNRLSIYEYDLSLPLNEPKIDGCDISVGRNRIGLGGYGNSIIAFKLHEPDNASRIIVDLI